MRSNTGGSGTVSLIREAPYPAPESKQFQKKQKNLFFAFLCVHFWHCIMMKFLSVHFFCNFCVHFCVAFVCAFLKKIAHESATHTEYDAN